LDAAHTQVTIDLAAGASAGGLNGTTLARAIALGRELPSLKGLWTDRASLTFGRLLRLPSLRPASSLLDGDYFLKQVTNLLAEETKPVPSTGTQPPSVTLLVTATALPTKAQGRNGNENGGEQGEDDSRRIYRFVSRPGLDADFDGITGLPAVAEVNDFREVSALALAARASASFPAAFQPVLESNPLQRQQLIAAAPDNRWLMDGGVLDNAPFGPVLDDLRSRAVSEDFTRVVLYVNPSAATEPLPPREEVPGIPKTLAGAVTAWRQIDRRLDRERLAEARLSARYTVSEPHMVLARLHSPTTLVTREGLARAAAELFSQYQANRRQSLYVEASGVNGDLNGVVDYAVGQPAGLVPATCAPRLAEGAGWQWGLTPADRILRWWGRALRVELGPGEHQSAFDALAPAQKIVQHWLDLFGSIDTQASGDVTQWYEAAEVFLVDQRLPQLLGDLMERTAAAVAPILRRSSGPDVPPELRAQYGAELLQTSLEMEVVNRALSWRSDAATDVMPFKSWEVTPASPDPNDLRPETVEPDEWASRKLYGERWGHFGAFASKAGREWDWLWGRLDAAMSLSAELLETADVPPGEQVRLQQQLTQAILTEEETDLSHVRDGAKRVIDLSGLDLALEWLGIIRSKVLSKTRKLEKLMDKSR
jgi:predicted acylesterase/phospholipase RssA